MNTSIHKHCFRCKYVLSDFKSFLMHLYAFMLCRFLSKVMTAESVQSGCIAAASIIPKLIDMAKSPCVSSLIFANPSPGSRPPAVRLTANVTTCPNVTSCRTSFDRGSPSVSQIFLDLTGAAAFHHATKLVKVLTFVTQIFTDDARKS